MSIVIVLRGYINVPSDPIVSNSVSLFSVSFWGQPAELLAGLVPVEAALARPYRTRDNARRFCHRASLMTTSCWMRCGLGLRIQRFCAGGEGRWDSRVYYDCE